MGDAGFAIGRDQGNGKWRRQRGFNVNPEVGAGKGRPIRQAQGRHGAASLLEADTPLDSLGAGVARRPYLTGKGRGV